jgi:peptidoglycan/LPS O-acetylase OafA/YrhL
VTAATAAAPATSRGRDRYFDVLRTAAIVWVVGYHVSSVGGQEWLGFWPAMGLLFAIAGSLTVRSIDRSWTEAIRSRLRRLLPIYWLMAVIAVPLMFYFGWKAEDRPLWRLIFWIFPIADPPGSSADIAQAAIEPLWYLRTYIWFVLLSPLLLILFRWYPRTMTLLPLAILALVGTKVISLDGLGDVVQPVLTDVLTFLACWFLGFAHREGMLKRMHWAFVVPLALVLIGGGTAWALTHPDEGNWDFNVVPLGQALYSLGGVLLLLRISPTFDWVGRNRVLNRLIVIINGRAMVIYLWHNVAIELSYPIGDRINVWRFGTGAGNALCVVIALVLTFLGMLLFGWIEDVAAGRRPQLLPKDLGKAKDKPPAADPAAGAGQAPDETQVAPGVRLSVGGTDGSGPGGYYPVGGAAPAPQQRPPAGTVYGRPPAPEPQRPAPTVYGRPSGSASVPRQPAPTVYGRGAAEPRQSEDWVDPAQRRRSDDDPAWSAYPDGRPPR